MLAIPKRAESSGSSSTLTLQKRALSLYSAASSSRTGESILQGPHHIAQKSRTTGISEKITSFSKLIRYYKDYERRHPQYKLVDIYADEGITGTCMDKRDDRSVNLEPSTINLSVPMAGNGNGKYLNSSVQILGDGTYDAASVSVISTGNNTAIKINSVNLGDEIYTYNSFSVEYTNPQELSERSFFDIFLEDAAERANNFCSGGENNDR